ncbi:hypothetical protein PUNSTDRAFT_141159 [Punctularia strigosozonata HHB-11173 SS5]|uniref:uncharacterized protein n=1 Tax=Punctularia strigosozonata (strain HHB-11173) TaxID=741275 RepID=UPI0004416A69|nr:uncharacterized protein PUNSTDRAFT_141159 [Punctularia strigosozonata HHB-11173 SS5]EIN12459.1 hypothetical protein PUNSTDRAFT_141159 [Punctularia strigosozonata HHB-11173 SS5]
MPRYGHGSMCAYALEEAAQVEVKKSRKRVVLTPEEREEKKRMVAARKEARDKKKAWDASLASEGRVLTFAMGTRVLLKSDAQRAFSLTPKEMRSLPYQTFACSPKTIYSLDSLRQLATRKRAALGEEKFNCDALAAMTRDPRYTMTIYGTRLTHLQGRPDKYDRMGCR